MASLSPKAAQKAAKQAAQKAAEQAAQLSALSQQAAQLSIISQQVEQAAQHAAKQADRQAAYSKEAGKLYEVICRHTLQEEISSSSFHSCAQDKNFEARKFKDEAIIDETQQYMKERQPIDDAEKSFAQLWKATGETGDGISFDKLEADILANVNVAEQVAFGKLNWRMTSINPKKAKKYDSSESSQLNSSDMEPRPSTSQYIVGEVSVNADLCDHKLLQLERMLCYLLIEQRRKRNNSELKACDVFALAFVGKAHTVLLRAFDVIKRLEKEIAIIKNQSSDSKMVEGAENIKKDFENINTDVEGIYMDVENIDTDNTDVESNKTDDEIKADIENIKTDDEIETDNENVKTEVEKLKPAKRTKKQNRPWWKKSKRTLIIRPTSRASSHA
ncbi:hypothetical protein BC936DRAFT_139377 [Jimgerdemannia flammicorona]|uniref:Uncharacterized protein n=1 Tax=Jimgerdemannia flammicorona TaxID=994334 RepID=A0A433DHX9_9FUNG|nr:hypothetical protein BC936DRAFT_139377 [Jimgerdemannia flammicorona]